MKSAKSTNMQRLKLVKPFLGRIFLGFVMMLIAAIIQLSFPKAISYFIDNVSENASSDWLIVPAIVVFFTFIIYCATTALRFYLFETTGAMIVKALRERLFSSIVRQEIGFFDTTQTGELTSRLTVDIDLLKDALSMNLAIMIRSLIVGIGGLVMIFILSPLLSVLVLITLPITLILTKWLGKKVRSKSMALQDHISGSVHIAQESFSNVRIIQAFNQTKKAEENYGASASSVLRQSIENVRLMSTLQGLSTFTSFSTLLITVLVGGVLITGDHLTIGELTSFILYAGMVSMSVNAISSLWGEWMRSYGATERVFELLERVSAVQTYQKGLASVRLQGNVEFNQVSFTYPGRKEKEVLHSFDLKIKTGEKVALVGPSGAGKTTVANLLLGFYEPKRGCIRFDGIDSATLDYGSIRDAISIVEQEPVLFTGTIAENIGFALSNPLDAMDKIQHAATQANAHDFILNFPGGYNTPVGEKGVQLSGGQKQRIAIARALIKDPRILILDEATSALDSESELLVQDALNKLMEGRTTIIIAHRYSTIAQADKLVVLDKGEVVQYGEHQDLIENEEGLYHKLVSNQMS
ncbi:MAG: ABC transporter transmembrane domain-containing protein [Cytophagales bacterium]|nr:ABC transporter transmembrane domain-containing protein [Cytophagales bacterium]